MRIIEIQGGLIMPVGNREYKLINKINESTDGFLYKEDLSERENELARNLVSRGALLRLQEGDSIGFKVNTNTATCIDYMI
jgi:hypothetical protein|tara:strand:+ start:483 stop:725 length:243 start_codon:yes stop_codon:yes gene_type:complete